MRTITAWVLIIGTIAFIALAPRLIPREGAELHQQQIATVELTLTARYVIGVHQLLNATQQAQPAGQTQSLLGAARQHAQSPLDQLRLVPVIAELLGPGAALEKLDEIEPKLAAPDLARDGKTLRQIYSEGVDALSTQEREQLFDRHGFFGKLALSWGKPSTDPLRYSVLRAAQRTVIALILLVLFVIAAFVTGVVLLIIFIILAAQGRIRRANRPPISPRPRLLESFAIYLLGMVGLSFAVRYVLRVESLSASVLILFLAPIALAWPAARLGIRQTAREIGFTPGRGAIREIALGLAGYITGIPIIAVGFLLTLILSKFAGVHPVHPIIEAAGKGPRVALELYLLACGVAPMVEETMFRGALYQWLRTHTGWIISGLIVGLLFAAVHPQGWTAFPALAAIGFVLAGIREFRGTLLPAMAAHAFNNFIAMTFLVVALG